MGTEVQKLEGDKISNPYKASSVAKNEDTQGGVAVESQRATIEIMTGFEVAKRFPRDMVIASDKILKECSRPTLAEISTYAYSKGGQEITGPTIRLMEAIARALGNIRFGWQCLESDQTKSSIRAYAYDLESNVLRETTFAVKHWRDTKNGGYPIKDEREIYELQANKAMRRVRGCLEGLVPRDVIDMALDQCEVTNKQSVDLTPEGLKKLLDVFAKVGVNKAMIEASRQGMKLEAMKAPQIVGLRKNYAALKDGLAKVEDLFDVALADKKEGAKKETGQPDLTSAVKEEKGKKKQEKTVEGDKKQEPAAESKPAQEQTPDEEIQAAADFMGAVSWEVSDFPADEGKLILKDGDGNEMRMTKEELFQRVAVQKDQQEKNAKATAEDNALKLQKEQDAGQGKLV